MQNDDRKLDCWNERIMKKLLFILLLSPLSFANIPASVFKSNDVSLIEKTCKAHWKFQVDINKCKDSWLLAKSPKDIYLPYSLEGDKEKETIAKEPSEIAVLQTELNKMLELKTYNNGCRTVVCITAWLEDYGFFLVGDNSSFLGFRKDNQLYGWTDSTTLNDKGESFGFNMEGAYEVNHYRNEDDRFSITLYGGKNECTYGVTKKGKYYWFDRVTGNYSNICPSMLMERVKLP